MAQEFQNKVDQRTEETLTRLLQSGNINFIFGAGASTPAISVAGDIEKEIEQLVKQNKDDEAFKKLESFIKSILPTNRTLITRKKNEEIDGEALNKIKNVRKSYQSFLKNIENILNLRSSSILPKKANLFSTNYDFFVESAYDSNSSLKLIDGIERSASLGEDIKLNSKEFFQEVYSTGSLYNYRHQVPTLNLIKLHGSLNWRLKENSVICDYSNIQNEEVDIEQIGIIMPTKAKFEQTTINRVYYDLLRIFSNELDKENSLLVSFGFSFRDEHILDIINRSLTNPTLQLLIFAYTKEEGDRIKDLFSSNNNVIVIMPTEDETIDFSSFNSWFSLLLEEGENE
jgi:hypothetical protein